MHLHYPHRTRSQTPDRVYYGTTDLYPVFARLGAAASAMKFHGCQDNGISLKSTSVYFLVCPTSHNLLVHSAFSNTFCKPAEWLFTKFRNKTICKRWLTPDRGANFSRFGAIKRLAKCTCVVCDNTSVSIVHRHKTAPSIHNAMILITSGKNCVTQLI